MYKLKTTGSLNQEFPLKTGAYRIGSAWDAEMVIQDPSIALYHCEVVVTPTMVTVRNLSPNHQIYVNEEPVQNATLSLGQKLRLGDVMLIMDHDTSEGVPGAPGAGPAAARKKKSTDRKPNRILEAIGLPLLILMGLAAVGLFIYRYQPAVFEAKKSEPEPAQPEQKAPAAPQAPANPDEPQAREMLEALKQPFDPKQTNRPPELDIQSGEAHLQNRAPRKAEPFLQRALRNQQKALGKNHPEVTKTLGTLGRVYRETQQFKRAEALLQERAENIEKQHGPNHPETGGALNDLGELQLASGQLSRAAPLLERALQVREKSLKPDQPELGSTLNNLAALKSAQGDTTNSTRLLERALKIFETNYSPNHPAVAKSLQHLGQLQLRSGNLDKAESTLQQALSRKEAVLPEDDPGLTDALSSLAAVHDAKKEYAKAKTVQERVVRIAEKTFGPDHPHTARAVEALATIMKKNGEGEQAVALLERAVKTAENSLGPHHPQTALALGKLADAQLCKPGDAGAQELVTRALRSQFRVFADVVWYGSEKYRLACRDRLNPYSLAAFLGSGSELASVALQYKAAMIDALLEDQKIARAATDPDLRFSISDLVDTKAELSELLFHVPDDFSAKAKEQRQSDRTALTTHLEKLENSINQRLPGTGRSRKGIIANLSDLQKAIGPDAAVIEFLRFTRCEGTNSWAPVYGAVIIGATGAPSWILLGSAEPIERSIQDYQNQLMGAPATASVDSSLATKLLRTLYDQLWLPLQKAIPDGAKRIVISPDAALNLVSFATLLADDDQFLAQKYSIRYVATARDLLEPVKASRAGEMFIFGNPDFWNHSSTTNENARASASSEIGPMDIQDLQSLEFTRLPATEQESGMLEFLVNRWKWPVRSLSGEKASELHLGSLAGPRVLHLATSGFFLARSAAETGSNELRSGLAIELFFRPQPSAATDENVLMPEAAGLFAGPVVLRNPIHRTGVGAAGAQATILAWREGKTIPFHNDGIVTAAEIAALNLDGTALAVLSASMTGVNEPESGEAVLAMRRAFIHAGAENLLMPLRTVSTEETTPLMMDLYARFDAGGDTAQVFSEIQRDWLVRLRSERGLPFAVRLAGCYVMNSIGPVR